MSRLVMGHVPGRLADRSREPRIQLIVDSRKAWMIEPVNSWSLKIGQDPIPEKLSKHVLMRSGGNGFLSVVAIAVQISQNDVRSSAPCAVNL